MEKDFSRSTKFAIILGVIAGGVALFYLTHTEAGGRIGISLNLGGAGSTLDDGLVAHYTFDGENMPNGQVNDRSASANHGSQVTISTTTAYVSGAIGQGLGLDGTDDYVEIDAVANDVTGSAISMTAWVKIMPVCTSTRICTIFGRNSSGGGNVFIFGVGDNLAGTALDNELMIHDTTGFEGDTDTVVADNTWHHVAYTRDGTVGRLYVDGVEKSTHDAGASFASSNTWSIGQEFDTGTPTDFLPGVIDEARIYNRELTALEVRQLYLMGATSKVAVTPTQSGAGSTMDDGLVGHWTFDGEDMPSGQVNDQSGSGYNGSMANIATSTVYGKGRMGQGLNLDGVDDQISFASVPSSLGSEFTVSIWANNGTGGDVNRHLIDIRGSGSSVLAFRFGANDVFFRDAAGNTPTGGQPALSVSTSTWALYTAVADGANVRTYKNGELVSSHAWGRSLDTSSTWYVGRSNSINFYQGMIDDLRVYTRALSEPEIMQLYKMGATSKIGVTPTQSGTGSTMDDGLVGHWTFDGRDMPSGQVNDRSSSGNAGSLRSAATTTVYVKGVAGQALQFDGTDDNVDILNAASNRLDTGTMSAWVRATSPGNSFRGIFIKSLAYGMYLNSSIFGIYDNGAATFRSTGLNLADGLWHHVLTTFDSGVANGTILYVDGAAVLTTTMTNSSLTGTVRIGMGQGGASQSLAGAIDDVRLYNRILSAAEIQQLYALGR